LVGAAVAAAMLPGGRALEQRKQMKPRSLKFVTNKIKAEQLCCEAAYVASGR
jgi:hypothetical protein